MGAPASESMLQGLRRARSHAGAYAAAIGLVAAVALAAATAGSGLDGANLAMLFLAPVLVSAVAFGLGPALVSALAAAIAYNFFFIEPQLTFLITRPGDLVTFFMFFAVALATGWLAGRARDQAKAAGRHAAAVDALLASSRALAAATTAAEVAQVLVEHASAAGTGAVVVLTPSPLGLEVAAGPDGVGTLSPAAQDAARQAYETGEPRETATDAAGGWRFLPLPGAGGRLAVLGVRTGGSSAGGPSGDFVTALVRQGAVALERAQLSTATAENEALRRADELRSALLNSISHDFRTPLSTVLGSATTLLEYEAELKPGVRRDLLDSIREEAQRLNRYVGDLLDMARLEAGALKPRRTWIDVREAAASALDRLGERRAGRKVKFDFARDLSRVRADRTLLEQAILNILENATAYSPPDSRIELSAHEDTANVVISIEDEGPGIAPAALADVFDKFRRLDRGTDRGEGLGLGLSIARGFVEAMDGRIAAASPISEGRGSRFVISLPKVARSPKGLL